MRSDELVGLLDQAHNHRIPTSPTLSEGDGQNVRVDNDGIVKL